MSTVRVRFAPSPTGYLHVGNARTAILNWLFARHSGGTFVLRIEDTDVERSTKEFEEALLEDLRWLKLDWDEGPDVGGEFGPYRQSERLHLYREYAEKLRKEGQAFYCYCTVEEVKARGEEARKRGEMPKYDGHCLNLTKDQIAQYEREGRKPVIRFHVPEDEIVFHDVVHGEIRFEGHNVSDFVILRSDGVATYNFAVVVDDALMNISHVIRGEDHLSNTPKQVLIYKALGFAIPEFVHIPMILGPDRSKLSKRHGASSVREYREQGYLPEALFNFLSLLGWSSPSGDEILSIERLIKEFTFERLSKSAAVFNPEKLNWMNGWYIRNGDRETVVALGIEFLEKKGLTAPNREYAARCVELVLEGVEYLAQLPEKCANLIREDFPYEASEWLRKPASAEIYRRFLAKLEGQTDWSGSVFRELMKQIQKETGVKGKDLWMPIRVALTGREHGPELQKIVELYGKEKCARLVRRALRQIE